MANGGTCCVFVDYENVREVDLGLVEGKAVRVWLLLGKHQTDLQVGMVKVIKRCPEQVELVEVGATGRNALDLTLAVYLGRAIEAAPEAQFYVISKDKDYDAMIAHLRSKGVAVARCEAFAGVPVLGGAKPKRKTAAVAPGKSPADARREKLVARLCDPMSKGRPKTREALISHIKTGLGKHWSEQDAAIVLAQVEAACPGAFGAG